MIIWGSFTNKINKVKTHEFQNQDTRSVSVHNGLQLSRWSLRRMPESRSFPEPEVTGFRHAPE